MQEIPVQVKSFQEVWEGDKELLRSSSPNLQIDWERELPSNEDAYALLVARGNAWQEPAQPFPLDESSLNTILDWLVADLQNLWGEQLGEQPAIEIVPPSAYLPRINELEREVNSQFGFGTLCQSPPTMYHFASHGTLVMPQKYLVRVPKGHFARDVTSANFDIIELEWDKPFLEQVLCEELSHAWFRQLRGEWKSDYVQSMKHVGPPAESQIGIVNESMAQYAKEVIARNGNPEWGLYVVGDKIGKVWQDRQGMDDYRATDALSAQHTLAQIAMVDNFIVSPDNNAVTVDFFDSHPYHSRKIQKFESPSITKPL